MFCKESSFPHALVTCGPSHEPIDRVRRLTNFSTGELGVLLSEALQQAGWKVLCLKGEMSSFRDPCPSVELQRFGTNQELVYCLEKASKEKGCAAVFHCAAVCDFGVRFFDFEEKSCPPIKNMKGIPSKISSRQGNLCLYLKPLPKLIARLPQLFPEAYRVGWKYMMDGSREQAIEIASQQIKRGETHACVVNGEAFGQGFGFLDPSGGIKLVGDKKRLAEFLVEQANEAVKEKQALQKEGS